MWPTERRFIVGAARQVDGALRTPGGPQKGLIGNYRFNKEFVPDLCVKHIGFKNSGLTLELRFLEGLGSSGELVGIIFTYPGTSPSPW